jgi:hypothetical protein
VLIWGIQMSNWSVSCGASWGNFLGRMWGIMVVQTLTQEFLVSCYGRLLGLWLSLVLTLRDFLLVHGKVFLLEVLHPGLVILRFYHLLDTTRERSLRWSLLGDDLLFCCIRWHLLRAYLIRGLMISLLLRQLNLTTGLRRARCYICIWLNWVILGFFATMGSISLPNHLSLWPILDGSSCLELIVGHEVATVIGRLIN